MAYTNLIPQHTKDASVEPISTEGAPDAYRLSVFSGGSNRYRLAQLDDYAKIPRRQFPFRYPRSLSLSARASSGAIPGTWGFGFWNNPFGMSLGFGGTGWRLPALPNAVWFFHASQENYLSFRAPPTGGIDTGENSARPTPPAGNGFLVQAFRSPRFHPLLLLAGLALPFSRKATRRILGQVIGEDGIRLSLDVTRWHSYRIDWREDGTSFEVDGVRVFDSPVSPRPPLGTVVWIDNQYAAFTPAGKIGFGVLKNPEPAWLEIKDVAL